MVKRDEINSLDDLRKRKKAVKLEMKVSEREFSHTVSAVKADAQEYALKRILLPAGVVIVGTFIAYKLITMQHDDQPDYSTTVDTPQPSHRSQSGSSLNLSTLIKDWWPLAQSALGFVAGKVATDERPTPPPPR